MTLDAIASRALTHCTSRYQAMLKLVEALVSTPSHTKDLAGVALCFDVLDAGLRALGFESARPEAPEGRPHLLATRPGAVPKAPTVLLLGHVDTIYDTSYPGGAFGVHGSRAQGPGIADMKAGLVMMVTALEALLTVERLDDFRIRVLVTSDHEHGAEGSRALIRRIASEAEIALVFGPADAEGGLLHSRSGTGRFRISMRGTSVAAESRSPEGRNAIVEMAHLIPQLESLNDSQRGIIVNCGVVRGGVRSGVVPAETHLDLEVWCDGPTDQRWIKHQLNELVGRASRGALMVSLTGDFSRPPWPPSARTQGLVEAWGHAAEMLGFEPLVGKHATASSDANITHDLRVPTLDGLGVRGGDLRTAEEWAAIQEMPSRAAITAIGLLAWLEDRGGNATWRVGGIIQGETPEDGTVEVSEDEDAVVGDGPEIQLDDAGAGIELSSDAMEGGDDIFNAPGGLEVSEVDDMAGPDTPDDET
ncbi:MAG: M20/M25/M40 family metallo-hydrolase [Myxococcota bacterium]